MSVLIGSWEFEGPFTNFSELRSEPGIVALLSGQEDEFELVDIDESDSVKDFLEAQVSRTRKKQEITGELSTAVYYCSDLNSTLRQGLIEELMKEFEPSEADQREAIA